MFGVFANKKSYK